jgi:hypothetical protein
MSGKTKGIILGGLAIGIISAIPFIGWGWFIWAILGGMLAAFLNIQSSPERVEITDGLLVGTLAGVLGGIINIIGYFIFLVVWNVIYVLFMTSSGGDPVQMILSMIIGASVGIVWNLVLIIPIIIFGLLGGLAGTALFEKRTAP